MLTHLFVYGTLLSNADNEFAKYLKSNCSLVGEAYCQGQLYKINWYPGMIPSTNPYDVVYGQLLEIVGEKDEIEEVLRKLDDYEGIDATDVVQNEYKREMIEVSCQNQKYHSWAYIYIQPVVSLERIWGGRFGKSVS